MNIFKNQKGLTLLELTVATALFATIVLITGNIYQSVVMSQRSAIAAQSVQETVRYALEVMSKEIRHAQGKTSGSECPAAASPNRYSTYNTNESVDLYTGDYLYFRNSSGDCVEYYLQNNGVVNRLYIDRDGMALPISPASLNITHLMFYVDDYDGDLTPPGDRFQPRVTIRLTVEMAQGKVEHKQRMDIQTTVSSRSYRN